MADLGVATAARIVDNLRQRRDLAALDDTGLRAALANEIAALLEPAEKPFTLPSTKPAIILMAGVNGAGKTTTIGKLAQRFMADGKSVMLAAGDTFALPLVSNCKSGVTAPVYPSSPVRTAPMR